jgi:hypothetical protein
MVMANAASVLERTADLSRLLQDSVFGGNLLVLAMHERVWNAGDDPHSAYLATRILVALCRGNPDAVRSCVELDTVRCAQRVGQNSHAALETESWQLLMALEAA